MKQAVKKEMTDANKERKNEIQKERKRKKKV